MFTVTAPPSLPGLLNLNIVFATTVSSSHPVVAAGADLVIIESNAPAVTGLVPAIRVDLHAFEIAAIPAGSGYFYQ